jgi:sugar-specific transcriptional regulator TrmB
MMSEQTDRLLSLLKPYGISDDESKIYLDLLSNGTGSALEISRRIHVGRTKVYRVLDTLIAKDLVVQRVDERGFKFAASDPKKLVQLLEKKEVELKGLREGLPQVLETLEQQTGFPKDHSKVLYYSGQKGLDRVNFNMLRADRELLSFEIETASMFMEKDRAEYLRRRLVEEKIYVRTITNAIHLDPYTEVSRLVTDFWDIRYMPAKEFAVKAEMFVYNDVYLVYHYTENDVFCIEIYNQDLADMQRQLFEYMWQRAQTMEKVGNTGEVRLV